MGKRLFRLITSNYFFVIWKLKVPKYSYDKMVGIQYKVYAFDREYFTPKVELLWMELVESQSDGIGTGH